MNTKEKRVQKEKKYILNAQKSSFEQIQNFLPNTMPFLMLVE